MRVQEFGPRLGYYPNAGKSWLVVKGEVEGLAKIVFDGTGIQITADGRRYLGSFIGSGEGKVQYVEEKIDEWCSQLKVLSKIGKSEPHAAYTAFVSGFRHRLTYYLRTIPNIEKHLKTLDEVIDKELIPALTGGHLCTPDERLLVSLPVRYGGLAIPIFSSIANFEHNNSKKVTKQLTSLIKLQDKSTAVDNNELRNAKKIVIKDREDRCSEILQELQSRMTKEQLRANALSRMKGASSWLTSLPLASEHFRLNKREFFDAICIRYRWQMSYMPSTCACGHPFSVDHALNCKIGGFIHQRHDDIRDFFAKLLSEVCKDVRVEPPLQPLTGERLQDRANSSDDARLDVSARSFWQRGQIAFFDVRVFNPFAKCHLSQKLENAFTNNEREKKRAYNQRVIDIEHGSFNPLVFTPYGGSGREAERFIRELSAKLSEKKDIPLSQIVYWLRTKLSFHLTRSAVLCIRGSRAIKSNVTADLSEVQITNVVGKIHK